MVLREHNDPLNQSRGIMGPLGNAAVQNNRGRLRQRFDLIRKLGQGTYGKVQLGIDKETGQEVAIKTIKKSKIETEADLIRIRREIQIMSSVRHPNIIHIYEVFENREKMVLVMEYAAGGELYDYLNDRKILQEDEARRIFRQIASAVYYCHKHKICHRDLKLENILLDEGSNAKIADFGLSNVFDDVNLLKTFCGSPLYASPEIVRGTPYYGPEVDCWSLGVLLYTLVYGAMPFDGSNFKRLVKQISNGDYYEPKKPAEASHLIRKMLTVDPIKRGTIKDVCAHEWINQGFDKVCLSTAEELANQTPVRLDVLLSVAPTHTINHSQVVIGCDRTQESEAGPSSASHALGDSSSIASSEPKKPKKDKQMAEEEEPGPSRPKGGCPMEKPVRASVRKEKESQESKGSGTMDTVKRKTAVKKKSKSSPVLELIVDEEEEIDREPLEAIDGAGEDEDAGDTLSEISEIQTIAEDLKDMTKSKSKLKLKAEEMKKVELKEEASKSVDKKTATAVPDVKESRLKPKTETEPAKTVVKSEVSSKPTPAPSVPAEKQVKEERPDKKPEKQVMETKVGSVQEVGKDKKTVEAISKSDQHQKESPEKDEAEMQKGGARDTATAPTVQQGSSKEITQAKEQGNRAVKKKAEADVEGEHLEVEKAGPEAVKPDQSSDVAKAGDEGADQKTKPPVKKKLVKKASLDKEKETAGLDEDKNKSSTKSVVATSTTGSSSSVASSAGGKSGTKMDQESRDTKSDVGPKPKLRPRSDSNSSDASPTRVERRNSKVISQKTAELIQNLETKQSLNSADSSKPKKLVFPSLKVSDAKRAFEKPPKPVKDQSSPPIKKVEEKAKVDSVLPNKPEKVEGSELAVQKPKKAKSKSPSPAPKSKEQDVTAQTENKTVVGAPSTEIRKEAKKILTQKEGGSQVASTTADAPKATQAGKEEDKAPSLGSTVPSERKQKSVSPKVPKKVVSKGVAKEAEMSSTNMKSGSSPKSPEPPSEMTISDSLNTEIDNGSVTEPPKKINARPLKKLKIPPPSPSPVPNPDQLVKPVLVDNGSGTPKQAVMLMSGKTTPPIKSSAETLDTSLSTDPFFSPMDSICRSLPRESAKPNTPAKLQNKEQAVKKISSVISRVASSESAERLVNEEKGKKLMRSEVSFPVAAAPSTERIIPIKLEEDLDPSTPSIPPTPQPPLLPQSSKTQSAPNISRIPPRKSAEASSSTLYSRQNSSDTESGLGPPPKPEPIRKSPREFIIPIKLEGSGQTVTPKEDLSEVGSTGEDPFRMDSRLRSGRFGRQRRYNSLLSDSSLDEETLPTATASACTSRRSSTSTAPCHTRSHSQGDEPDTPSTPLGSFRKYRVRHPGGLPLDRSDSFSSAEEDEEDAFEVLTAESLFSSLLDRVRNLTKRINRDEGPNPAWQGPESPSLLFGTGNPFRELMSRAPSESRTFTSSTPGGTYSMTRSFSREPSVTVTISTGPTWRRSLSREMSGDSDSASAFSEPQSASHNPPSRSGSSYQWRGSGFQGGADSVDNCTVRSLPMNFSSPRRTPFGTQRSEPHGIPDSSLASTTYHPPTPRPYGRTLSNSEFNTSVTLPFRRSLKTYDRPSPSTYVAGNEYGSGDSGFPSSSSSSPYVLPTRTNSVLNRYMGSGRNSVSSVMGNIPESPYSRFSRSLSRVRGTPDPDTPTYRDPSMSRQLETGTASFHNTPSQRHADAGESNGWVGGSNSSSVKTAAASSATMTTQEKMNNYQNYYKGLSENPLRSCPEPCTSPTGSWADPLGEGFISSPKSAFARSAPPPCPMAYDATTTELSPFNLTASNLLELAPAKVMRPVKPLSPHRSFTTRELGSPAMLGGRSATDTPGTASNIPKWPSISIKTHRPVNVVNFNEPRSRPTSTSDNETFCQPSAPLKVNTHTKTLPFAMQPLVVNRSTADSLSNSPSLASSPVTSPPVANPNNNIVVAVMRPRTPSTFRVMSPPPSDSSFQAPPSIKPPSAPDSPHVPSSSKKTEGGTSCGNTPAPPTPATYPKIPRRDTRATSVEKITRLLERRSMPRDRIISPPPPATPPALPLVSPTDTTYHPADSISPSSTLTLKSEDECTDRSLNASPEKFKSTTNYSSNSLQRKPKFIQSLEKKWEKLTTGSKDNPVTSTNSQPAAAFEDSDDSEVQTKPDSESMLLQRAVSPEKKMRTKFGSSTVNFMLGKFRKFEETSAGSRIPSGKPPVGSLVNSKVGRRVQSAYAGASSDSVLALPREVTPCPFLTSGTKDESNPEPRGRTPKSRLSPATENSALSRSCLAKSSDCSTNRDPCSNSTNPGRPSLGTGSISGAVGISSSGTGSSGVNSSLIPRPTRHSTPQGNSDPVQVACKSKECAPQCPSPPVPPHLHINLDSKLSEELDENLLTPTSVSDSFDSSSVCSEKTELSTRSVLEDEESVSERIFRKSFYPRFNSLDRKKSKSTPSNSRHYGPKPKSGSVTRSSISPSNLAIDNSVNVPQAPAASNLPTLAPTTEHQPKSSAPPSLPTLNSNNHFDSISESLKINKYNPNPLFKELITEDFKTDVGSKAEYSRRVTSKLSKLLREIESDIGSTGSVGSTQTKHNNNHVKNSLSAGAATSMNGSKIRKPLSPSPGRKIMDEERGTDANNSHAPNNSHAYRKDGPENGAV